MGGAPLRRTVSNRVCSRWSYYFVIHSAQAIGCGDRLEGSPKVSFCASLGEPRSKARAIHIHRRVPGKAFSLLVVSNTLRGDLFRVFPGALVNVENAARVQASCPRRRLIWLQTHSKDEFGKGWKRARSSIRADLPPRILGKGVWGPAGWGGPTHSIWKCLFTSGCRDHRGRHDHRRARRRARHAHHHRRRARRHNHHDRRRRALPEDALR
jgi:hypothetical protein